MNKFEKIRKRGGVPMTQDMIPVSLSDPMPFVCGPDNVCFNDCCRDLNQVLTPYDVLRLKNNLQMPSRTFLQAYTIRQTGPTSGLPVVSFRFDPSFGHACPFVTEAGCSVYPDRPGSCRLYPLARAISRSRQSGEIQEYYALIQEDHCKGFKVKEPRTVGQWLSGQKVEAHNRNNDKLMELIQLKNRIMPGPLTQEQSDQFFLALYDLDEFRHRIFSRNLMDGVPGAPKLMENIGTGDEALLDLGLKWVRYQWFGMDMDRDAGRETHVA
jgi:Fe-S-cluster containining protein